MAPQGKYSDVVIEKRLRPGMTRLPGTLIMRGKAGAGLRDGALIMVIEILLRKQAKTTESTLCVHQNVKYGGTRGYLKVPTGCRIRPRVSSTVELLVLLEAHLNGADRLSCELEITRKPTFVVN